VIPRKFIDAQNWNAKCPCLADVFGL